MNKNSRVLFILSIIIFLIYEYENKPAIEFRLPEKMNTNQLTLIGFGSPIVDGIMNYESDPQLAEELKLNMKYHLSKESSMDLYYSAFDSTQTEILLGGSALNTVRVTNFLLKFFKNIEANGYEIKCEDSEISNELGYIGMIGKDKYGSFVKSKLAEEDVVFLGSELEDKMTSTAVVLIEKRERHIFAHISASKKINSEHLKRYYDLIANSKIFYADSYLIHYSFSSYEYIFKNFAGSDVILALSLSNDSLIEDNFEKYIELFPYVDIIIGNSDEFEMIKKLMHMRDLKTSEFLDLFSEKIEKYNTKKERVIVNTRGKTNSLIHTINFQTNLKEIIEVPSMYVDDQEIIDLNGAGDGFAGGFFTGIILNMDLYHSGLLGNKIASEIIKLKGFQLPYSLEYKDLKNLINSGSPSLCTNLLTKKIDL